MNITPDLILGVVCGAALSAFFLTLAARSLLGILQQEGYSGCALLRHLCKKKNMQRRRLALLSLSLALLTALFCVCFSFVPKPYPNLIALLPYAVLYAVYCLAEKHALKVPLRPTARVIRLCVALYLLLVVFCSGLGLGLAALSLWVNAGWLYLLRFVPFALLPLLLPLFLAAANGVMKVYEIPHGKSFVRRASSVLEKSDCIKVGITGSFGKTSVKRYAAAMLSTKFRVKATPESYNTPLGIARFVNAEGADCDIFLAEMGARRRGDIAELCDMVKPTVGLITGVCPQHLETFKTLNAIYTEKGTLAARTSFCILGSSASTIRCEHAQIEGKDFAAEDVTISSTGTDFVLKIGEKTAPVHTNLLGKHAAEDIALSAALSVRLGMTFEEVVAVIPSLTPVPHRLERTEQNGLVILDDSYNSNVQGAQDAVEILRLHEGGKAIVTPGLVELGELEEDVNEGLGSALVGLDLVVLVGETRVLAVRNGYLQAGGDAEKLVVVPTLKAAQDVLQQNLKEGDCVLFLNDLPDKY